jgi:chorismate synthase
MFSIPAIKGIEFGRGFGLAEFKGSEANDPIRMENGRAVTLTNNNGGINGGITNGMPIVFRCAVKPTPSIFKEQSTVNMMSGENAALCLEGRHDPAIIHRARVVVDSMTAFVVADLLAGRYGTDFLATHSEKI